MSDFYALRAQLEASARDGEDCSALLQQWVDAGFPLGLLRGGTYVTLETLRLPPGEES